MLKRLPPTLLSGKAFAVFERLAAAKKEDYKSLTKALTEAFGGDENGKHLAMMAFRSRMRKPEKDVQVFAYNLEALLRRAMPKIEKGDSETLLKQQFVEGVSAELKRQLLQRPTLSYEETVAVAQQLDLAGQIYSSQADGQVNQTSTSDVTQPMMPSSPLVANECRSPGGNSRRTNYRQRQMENYCFVCVDIGHFARECQFRFQSPAHARPRQGNDQGPTRY